MNEKNIKEILERWKTVAIVGLSKDASKDSHRVSEYLKSHGFKVMPVNPTADQILGERSYRSLSEIPPEIKRTIDIVNIFRPSEEAKLIVEQVVKMKEHYDRPSVVWMQLGVINEEAAALAREEGMTVVMNQCMMRKHKELFSEAK